MSPLTESDTEALGGAPIAAGTLRLREMCAGDHSRVLELNLASEHHLSPLDRGRLEWISALACRCVVVESAVEVVGFAFSIAPDSAYDSRNYAWLSQRFERFLYVDRVVVCERSRRRGIATLIYDELEVTAVAFGRVVCDINVEPPNEASLAFHRARGYREQGRLTHPDGHIAALLCKVVRE